MEPTLEQLSRRLQFLAPEGRAYVVQKPVWFKEGDHISLDPGSIPKATMQWLELVEPEEAEPEHPMPEAEEAEPEAKVKPKTAKKKGKKS